MKLSEESIHGCENCIYVANQDSIVIPVDIAKIFQKKNLILQDVNLKIDQGEFVYLIGKTGAGKSTGFADSTMWCFFKKCRANDPDDFIRLGETEMAVTVSITDTLLLWLLAV